MSTNLNRFKETQKLEYHQALAEIHFGEKVGHWMWFIFPQILGLAQSATSRVYAISSLEEAHEYWEDRLLGNRLFECTKGLLKHLPKPIEEIMDPVDCLKLRSSLSLFYLVSGEPLFKKALDAYFDGSLCTKTKAFYDANIDSL